MSDHPYQDLDDADAELRAVRQIFWTTNKERRDFALCMRYFRAVFKCNLLYNNDTSIENTCPKHLVEALQAQIRLEGLI